MGDFLRALSRSRVCRYVPGGTTTSCWAAPFPPTLRWRADRRTAGRVELAAYRGIGRLDAMAGGSGVGRCCPLLRTPVPPLVAWAAITGMLHLDGWADCCYAFVAPLSRERRLEAMKDPGWAASVVRG